MNSLIGVIMKELLVKLAGLRAENISAFSTSDAKAHLDLFKTLNQAALNCWELFKLFDSDLRDTRTLEILNNHADGSAFKRVQILKCMTSPLYTNASLVHEGEINSMKIYQDMASFYLEYRNQKETLDKNEALIVGRIEELKIGQGFKM